MSGVPRKRLDHEIPSWVDPSSTYFVTICAQRRGVNQLCLPEVGKVVMDSVAFYHSRHVWYCELGLLMPDHVHLLLNLPEQSGLSSVVGTWKKWICTKVGIQWQENFFDHRIRAEESLSEKMDYILYNPVRAGLVRKAEAWPYVFMASRGG